MELEKFIARWQAFGSSEMATVQSFAIELTEILTSNAPISLTKMVTFLTIVLTPCHADGMQLGIHAAFGFAI